ncbi:MAG: class I tRNA ligase family protein [Patescibacteria group bacterium]|nr:class I tRNA ligase family protein [Patescibacteria group bacterium]
MQDKFDHKGIENKWHGVWEEEKIYLTPSASLGAGGEDKARPKYYVLDMFPYPSGAGLHVGHPKGYIATDILARMKMMSGFNVLHPIGWDAFGLPAENYALKNKVHPRIATEKNIATFKSQLEKIGLTYDWEREINTTDPEYYKWTQWAFIKMWEKGLAYESTEPIIWCPTCQTGLAMEDLENGKCERCESEVVRKPMRQWVIKITDYAERLLNDLDKLSGWEDSIKEMQRNWIGRSEGAEVKFEVRSKKAEEKKSPLACPAKRSDAWERGGAAAATGCVTVFTTRPDTLFGCTYVVLAPEHPEIGNWKLEIGNWKEVESYINEAKKKTDLQRTDLNKDKFGVKLEGVMAVNPANQEEVPVFIADYVLPNYGTGAIMAVPAHDQRDFEFAQKYDLPIRTVVTTNKDNIVGVGAMIETKEGKFLFQRRDKKTDRNPGMLSFFGGGTENNEDTKETLKREIKEELNLEIKNNFVLLNKFESINHPGRFLDLFYVNNVDEENMKLGEGAAIEKFDLAEALQRDDVTPFTKNVIKYLQDKKCFTEEGINENSDFLDGLKTVEAKKKMIEWLEKEGKGKRKINYKLNDWVFSRQRYWGEPIPMVHCEKCGTVPVAEKDLPVRLPEVEHYEPTGTGESPLANITEWVNTTCPKCGGPAKRETNTMPQWAGSSWYYLRYIDPKNNQALVDKEKEKYWSPVDFYVGGAEHATRHLIYARFWHKFLFDIGVVNYEEPFAKFTHVGLIMAEDGRKMSKRWGNVINPDDIIEKFGADAMRVYEMFMGPFTQSCAWSTNGLTGARKFLDKVWVIAENSPLERGGAPLARRGVLTPDSTKEIKSLLHKTIKKVSEDIADFKFNTCISAMMILSNMIEVATTPDPSLERRGIGKEDFAKFIQILAPFAPHLAEEIWREKLGNKESVFKSAWPEYDKELIKDETVNLVVQVNGKLRATISVPAGISKDEARDLVLKNENVKKWLAGKKVTRDIYVPDKLFNIVVVESFDMKSLANPNS